MLLLRFAGLFFLCFQLTSCMESHVLGMESFLSLPSSSVMGQLNWNFLKGFHKHFYTLNYVVYFTITAKYERMKDVDRTGLNSSTCLVMGSSVPLLCYQTIYVFCRNFTLKMGFIWIVWIRFLAWCLVQVCIYSQA